MCNYGPNGSTRGWPTGSTRRDAAPCTVHSIVLSHARPASRVNRYIRYLVPVILRIHHRSAGQIQWPISAFGRLVCSLRIVLRSRTCGGLKALIVLQAHRYKASGLRGGGLGALHALRGSITAWPLLISEVLPGSYVRFILDSMLIDLRSS